MNKQFLHKTLPIMAALGLLCGAERAFKEPEMVGPQPAVQTVKTAKERQIVRCGEDFDGEGLEVVVFLVGLAMAGAVMSWGR